MLPHSTLPESEAAPLPVLRPRRTASTFPRASRSPARDRDIPMTGGSTDLLAVTPGRIQRALWRSFLRYGVTGELDIAVNAAMNVVGPVLAARDAEITRLRRTLSQAVLTGTRASPARRRRQPAEP